MSDVLELVFDVSLGLLRGLGVLAFDPVIRRWLCWCASAVVVAAICCALLFPSSLCLSLTIGAVAAVLSLVLAIGSAHADDADSVGNSPSD